MERVSILIYALGLAIAISCTVAMPARAGQNCGERSRVIEMLGSKYKEAQHGSGVISDSLSVMEIWVSRTGSWSMLQTFPSGVTCVLASGGGWSTQEAPDPLGVIDGNA